MAFALVSSGDAHAVSREAYFTSGSSFCIGERSSIYQSSFNGVLYGESVTRSLGNYYGPCTAAITKPAGYLAGRVFVYKWDERSRDWFVCRRSGWLYNSGSTYALGVYAPLGYPGNRWCEGLVRHRGPGILLAQGAGGHREGLVGVQLLLLARTIESRR